MTTEAQGEVRPARASRAWTVLVAALALVVLALIVAWLYAAGLIAYVLLSDWCLDPRSTCPQKTTGDAVFGIAQLVLAVGGSVAAAVGLARLARRGRRPGARWPLALAAVAAALWTALVLFGLVALSAP